MKDEKEVNLFDKIVISLAVLAGIISLFKGGLIAALLKFIFVIIFFYATRGLFLWIIKNNE
ncbi:hypothetical protein [uncultured Tolumonas sp.]|uniref:hypothetical protein n=1 Tax=uncultured Tolumonas sp. TaxID=263765 RepID=UPI00292F99E3|nr:hypothetical protein [uncultured Tolumonas sp.]